MNLRPMGDTGMQCSVIGLGTGRLASASGGLSRAGAARLIDTAADCGIDLIDTADSYGQGECEKLIGAALAGKRDRFIIVTKAGFSYSGLGGGLRLIKPLAKRVFKLLKRGKSIASSVRTNVAKQNFTPEYISNCVHASLQRLQTDRIDVFLLHSPPPQVVAEGELFETLRRLKQEGKIRHFGISSPEPEALQNALQIRGVATLELPVNPEMVNERILTEAQQANKAVLANQISLSGKLLENGGAQNAITSLAAKKDVSVNHLLIQFALLRPAVSCVLTGTTNPAHLKQNVADALAPIKFSTEELSTIGKMNAVATHD